MYNKQQVLDSLMELREEVLLKWDTLSPMHRDILKDHIEQIKLYIEVMVEQQLTDAKYVIE